MDIIRNPAVEDLLVIQPGLLAKHGDYAAARIRDGMAFLAKMDNKPIGFLIYGIIWGNTPFIEHIKIVPDAQRQGIGSKLLEAAKIDIKTKGFAKLLSSTEVINGLGLGFHAKHSFKDIGMLAMPHGDEKFYELSL
ncbi:MAG: GNAT family N-acetyltransferase [Bdellovibrionales bacterium]